MEQAGEEPDVVIGCFGGGSNFGGLALPYVLDRLAGKGPRIVAVEPTACPSLTKGRLRLRLRRHRQAHAADQDVHAGPRFRSARHPRRRLRYHGASPLISHLRERGTYRGARLSATARLRLPRCSSPERKAFCRRRNRRTPFAARSTKRWPRARKAAPARSSSASAATATSTSPPTRITSAANWSITSTPRCRRDGEASHPPGCGAGLRRSQRDPLRRPVAALGRHRRALSLRVCEPAVARAPVANAGTRHAVGRDRGFAGARSGQLSRQTERPGGHSVQRIFRPQRRGPSRSASQVGAHRPPARRATRRRLQL